MPAWTQFAASVQVLEFYGLEKQNKWAQLGYESLFFAGFTFLAWAVGVLIMSPSQIRCQPLLFSMATELSLVFLWHQ